MEIITEFTLETCTKENIEKVIDGINEFNLSKVPAISDTWDPLEFVAKTKNGIEIGGILAGIGYWNGLEIKVLWVEEKYRNKGIGTWILKHAEKIAREKGVKISMLDTFDFQAEKFYLKNGYETIGEIKDFPKGHRRIYLSKKL
ncbi:Ribosomal protein S18 acetylase RimI [Flavobacterium aquidurense]|uniref:GNAT family N-acetyltransferase n=1 Tax=Flavobacterium frigidimaris TaxID=262320 RepID=UPI000898BF8E|nr:GNAT family N-acetyltransferase [Flavobacterium frigidimaris]SDY31192.1 Ribosomal protein S18 acetylase RimI [Flavobacterium aquidurense]